MSNPKIVAITPAGCVSARIAVNDISTDSTVEVARKPGLPVFLHRESLPSGLGGSGLLGAFLFNRKGLITSRMFRPLLDAYPEVAASPWVPGPTS